jgi:hypothetical protein
MCTLSFLLLLPFFISFHFACCFVNYDCFALFLCFVCIWERLYWDLWLWFVTVCVWERENSDYEHCLCFSIWSLCLREGQIVILLFLFLIGCVVVCSSVFNSSILSYLFCCISRRNSWSRSVWHDQPSRSILFFTRFLFCYRIFAHFQSCYFALFVPSSSTLLLVFVS